jgi:hypothetical protein
MASRQKVILLFLEPSASIAAFVADYKGSLRFLP